MMRIMFLEFVWKSWPFEGHVKVVIMCQLYEEFKGM